MPEYFAAAHCLQGRCPNDRRYKFITQFGPAQAFENHSGRTYFDDQDKLKPFGTMIEGYGNNPDDHTEGMRYKNVIGSYSHGPLLKNLNIAEGIMKLIIQNHQDRLTHSKEAVTA